MRRCRSRRARIVTWTKRPSESLLDDVRAGAVDPDDAVAACAACPSPTSASPGSTTTGRCARACPRRSTGRARRPSSAPRSSASCSPRARAPGAAHPGRRRPGRRRRSTAQPAAASPTATRVVWRPLAADRRRAGRWSSPPAPPTSRWPTSAPPCSTPTASPPTAHHRRRRGRPAPPARPRRRAGRGRRRRRRRRHGGRAGQRGRRAHRRARSSPCRRASATAPRFEGVTALLAMLASCAAGVTVVGIDNGFGAAVRGRSGCARRRDDRRADPTLT